MFYHQDGEPAANRGVARGRGRGRGGRPVGPGRDDEGRKSDTALEVTHIPPADNTVERLMPHFSKFGAVASIQVCK